MAVSWSSVFESNDDWRARAACRHTDATVFFPIGSSGPAIEYIERARSYCQSCPVQQACLQFALETNQEDGIWGGKDEAERRRLRREWRAARRMPNRFLTA